MYKLRDVRCFTLHAELFSGPNFIGHIWCEMYVDGRSNFRIEMCDLTFLDWSGVRSTRSSVEEAKMRNQLDVSVVRVVDLLTNL